MYYFPFHHYGANNTADWYTGRNGVATGSPSSAAGKAGNALSLGGSGNPYVLVGDEPELRIKSPFTECCWVRVGAWGSYANTLISKGTGTNWEYYVQLKVTTHYLEIAVANSSYVFTSSTGSSAPSLNTWTHFAWGVDENFYVWAYFGVPGTATRVLSAAAMNGTFYGTQSGATGGVSIGALPAGAGYNLYSSRVDELIRWDRAVSDVELKTIYDRVNAGYAGLPIIPTRRRSLDF